MRILITGGTGFIGSRVAKELKRRKHTVHLLVARLAHIGSVEKEMKRFNPQVVIHLAWEGLPDVGSAMSAKNRVYGITFFKLVEKLSIPKLIAVGTAWEYESAHELEAHKHKAFVAAKRALRAYGGSIMKKNKGTFIWVVPFFVYGNGKKATSLIPSLIAQARRREVPTPKNPDVWHDFVYVDDVAIAIALLAERQVSSGAYDIGTGKLTRTADIAKIIARIYNVDIPKSRRIAARGRRANTRVLTRAVGWKPKMTLQQGIKGVIKEADETIV